MNDSKLTQRLFKVEREVCKSQIALFRALNSIDNELAVLKNTPIDNKLGTKEWGDKFLYSSIQADLDIHTLVIQLFHLLKYVDRVKSLKKIVLDSDREIIELMRHHYEHWEEIEPFYRLIPNKKQPEAVCGSSVDKFKKYQKNRTESPVGSIFLDWDLSKDQPRPIYIIGGVLNLNSIQKLFSDIKTVCEESNYKN